MITEEYRGTRQWSRNRQAVATAGWISFLAAAIATMVFFAIFDPVEIAALLDPELEISRDAGYAIGFFAFWILCALSAGVTAWLVRTAPKRKNR
ncbi:MAG: hypothetical protein R3176_09545 [Woeseiaceae bacterium]|nr:hypothetical protein [Woeseiaceae bacterium]